MDEAPVTEVPRGLRIARLAIVPLALVLVAALLLGRSQAAGKTVTTKLGATTQGREFRVDLDEDGHVTRFSTALAALCPNGTIISLPWDPADGDPVDFERDGDRLRVREDGDGWKLALDGTVGENGGLRGTVSLVMHITPERKPAYDCTSPHVRFFAGA